MMNDWQPIETAPKGGGADLVTSPNWVEPPPLLLLFEDGVMCICRWEWSYAEGGYYCTNGKAWVDCMTGERACDYFGDPTHWMPPPPPPNPS